MASARTLEVKSRELLGTGNARAERRSGFVPAILYGDSHVPTTLAVEERVLRKELQSPGIFSHLYTISVNGKDHNVLIKDIQFHPVSDRPLHVDFLKVSKSSSVHVDVPVTFINEDKCPGLKNGGVLNVVHHTLHVSCSPNHIPESIELDLTGKEVGHACHANDLHLPKGVTLFHVEETETIYTIALPKEEKEPEEPVSAITTPEETPVDMSSEEESESPA